uniref:C2H2-type domain-containing protein n=1 Tax=Compsopogon caeruleus TaxID=31354 RepID=A0A7S1TE55_9RHOD|mmetsp:Transcript_2310/g.3981  ORF Transcript_2310/g.3981 Transcript_2310/m.3981 type:complete len:289 (+) Transcript_2310:627-1493(+)|eukprot:CAMPEP_0184685746 /NCGR_PEP_ID=MMETSP0312-20130426/20051_1 /TAXON_ID=31354 /ORGANISM="Compsopogon coeruleus, Strain SAG 36.94" /LENGTH=288 /DNA_ID=CAMNT_0027140161 /DNA_START=519 /DNA_END=1385 /DNA_ORIENTATION=-
MTGEILSKFLANGSARGGTSSESRWNDPPFPKFVLPPPALLGAPRDRLDQVAAASMVLLGSSATRREYQEPPEQRSPASGVQTLQSLMKAVIQDRNDKSDSFTSALTPSPRFIPNLDNPGSECTTPSIIFDFPTVKCRQSFNCHICRKEFDRKSNLNKHIRQVHEKLRPYGCNICGKKFGQKSSIDKHILVVHEKRKIHKCDRCSASFGQVGDLNVHIRTVHEKRRPYGCATCGATFGLRSHLNKHIRVVHEKVRPYSCSLCVSTFGENSDLKKHMKSVHHEDDVGTP